MSCARGSDVPARLMRLRLTGQGCTDDDEALAA